MTGSWCSDSTVGEVLTGCHQSSTLRRMGAEAVERAARPEVVPNAVVPAVLIGLAAVGWFWSFRTAGTGMGQSMAFVSFLGAWVAMMAAMMLPAVTPVIRLYVLAAAQGRVAPVPFFLGGYLLVWSAPALPAYLVWRALSNPLMMGATWVGRLAGVVFLLAALWQLSPLRSACLRRCRSPLSVFLRAGAQAETPTGALRLGTGHGLYCLGCCWAVFAVFVVVGTMNLVWMIGLTAVIFGEKILPFGARIVYAVTPVMAGLGVLLLVDPRSIVNLS